MGRGKLQKRPCADIMSTSSAVTGDFFLKKNVKITTKIFHSTREKWILRC